jgi:hypothetical protein
MENCYTAAEPAILIAGMLGMFPMTFYGPARKKCLKIGWSDIAKSFCMILTLGFVTVANFLNKAVLNSRSEILFIVWKFVFSLQYLVIFLLVFYQLSKFKSISKFLRKVDESDTKVRSSPNRTELKNSFLPSDQRSQHRH